MSIDDRNNSEEEIVTDKTETKSQKHYENNEFESIKFLPKIENAGKSLSTLGTNTENIKNGNKSSNFVIFMFFLFLIAILMVNFVCLRNK